MIINFLIIIQEKMINYVSENIKNIFLNICPYIELDEKKKLVDLGIDSLSFVKIVIEIEVFFVIKFNDEDLNYDKLNTLDDVCNYVLEKLRCVKQE